ncbi:MAG: tryptophan-rich sensory protein [Xanthomonadales bacterium]
MMSRYGSLVIFLLLVVAVAVAAAGFEAGNWYFVKATRPDWSPPPWLFGPAWALAYSALALAAWQAWLSGRGGRGGALVVWLALLASSGAWSWLVFGLHRPGWAVLELAVALVLAGWCTARFRRLSRQAAWLMLPFGAWIAFVWAWTLALWTLNGGPFLRFLA